MPMREDDELAEAPRVLVVHLDPQALLGGSHRAFDVAQPALRVGPRREDDVTSPGWGLREVPQLVREREAGEWVPGHVHLQQRGEESLAQPGRCSRAQPGLRGEGVVPLPGKDERLQQHEEGLDAVDASVRDPPAPPRPGPARGCSARPRGRRCRPVDAQVEHGPQRHGGVARRRARGRAPGRAAARLASTSPAAPSLHGQADEQVGLGGRRARAARASVEGGLHQRGGSSRIAACRTCAIRASIARGPDPDRGRAVPGEQGAHRSRSRLGVVAGGRPRRGGAPAGRAPPASA